MFSDPEMLRCTELISQAALDPDGWASAMTAVAAMFRSDHAMVFSNKESWSTWPFIATAGLDDDDLARFFSPETLHLWEPWHQALLPGKVVPHQKVVGDRDFEKTEIYNDIIRPTGTFYGTCFQHDMNGLSFHLNVCRRRRAGEFSPHELQVLQFPASHITLALQLQHRFAALERQVSLPAAVLDQMVDGAIVVDITGRPLVVNAAAERLLLEGDGIALGMSGLRGATKSSTDSLRTALARAAAPGGGHVTKMHVSRRLPRTPLMVEVFPVCQLAVATPGSPLPFAVIFLRESSALLKVSRPAIMEFYRLTPREAEISSCLADGLTVEMIAEKLDLAKGTVRNNLKRVFEKTDTHSQVALLAALRGFESR